jgi:hypothetical protein
MGKHSEVFVTLDVAKKKHAVAIAEGGRSGGSPISWRCRKQSIAEPTIGRLADRYDQLQVCFEAGPMDTCFIARSSARPRPYGGRSGLDPETFGRAHQDEPARRGQAAATATARRVDT